MIRKMRLLGFWIELHPLRTEQRSTRTHNVKGDDVMSSITRLLGLVLAVGLSTSALAVESDWGQVALALGKSGSEMPGGIYRVGLPRGDLKVMLDGVEIKPALALGSWLAFQKIGDQAMVMGDLVLTAEEVNAVMNKLVEDGIDITALHNHLLRSSPTTLYICIFAVTAVP